jgi:Flp pilus assembly pilin Flp
MNEIRTWFTRVEEQAGQGLTEYALLLALIAVVAILALLFLGSGISQTLSVVGDSV